MQAKISCFFKPTTDINGNPTNHLPSLPAEEERDVQGSPDPEVVVTYKRRNPRDCPSSEREGEKGGDEEDASEIYSKRPASLPKVLNKKRNFVQYHLELGQSDFILHSCRVCGLSYARGDEGDEKVHQLFHRNYHRGIHFKGWKNERVIPMPGNETEEERILLVLDTDPPGKKHKVQEVVKLMANDLYLSDEWLLHKLCKTYLFISRKRIVGCLILEPISTAHKVIPKQESSNCLDSGRSTHPVPESHGVNSRKLVSSVLQFGNVTFRREAIKRCYSDRTAEHGRWDSGALFYEEEALHVVCGVRAIWVAPSHRRKRVATRLLDAGRKNFRLSSDLALSDCAFSAPTSAGRAFSVSYSGTESFMVYKNAEDPKRN